MSLPDSPERMWINAPSKHNNMHTLHGRRVIAFSRNDSTTRAYMIDGPTISLEVPNKYLSAGWPETSKP